MSSLPRVSDILCEKRSISPEMAVLLSAYFGTSDGYWINLQAHFDLEMAKVEVGKEAVQINPILMVRTVRCGPCENLGGPTKPRARTLLTQSGGSRISPFQRQRIHTESRMWQSFDSSARTPVSFSD